jgi:hypothetical protein
MQFHTNKNLRVVFSHFQLRRLFSFERPTFSRQRLGKNNLFGFSFGDVSITSLEGRNQQTFVIETNCRRLVVGGGGDSGGSSICRSAN